MTVLEAKNLPRIHPVLRVERLLDEAHQADRERARLLEAKSEKTHDGNRRERPKDEG